MLTVFVFLCFIVSPSLVNAASIAKVIAVIGEVTLERAGKNNELKLKDDIHLNDIIRTDSDGKVQLLFNDNSAVTIGVNSNFVMENYSDGDSKSFKSNIVTGLARFVTGSIVESNPEAFSVRTPEATVGIRGTTLAILSSEGQTSVSTENSTKQQSVVVNDTIVPPGYMAIFGPNANVISPPTLMTPAQRQKLIDQTRIGTPIAAAINISSDTHPESVIHGLTEQDDLNTSLNSTRLLATTNASFQSTLDEEARIESILATETAIAQDLANSMDVLGFASGKFEFEGFLANDTEGTFTFEANLTSGNISQASFYTSNNAGGVFTVIDASGTITPGSFNISGGNASFDPQGVGVNTLNNWNVQGTEALQIGEEVEGNLTINSQGGNYTGEIEGQLHPK